MNLETVTVPIEPRTVGACIDLALVFCRHHARPVLGLAVAFGAPSTAAAYAWTKASPSGWLWSLLLFFVLSAGLGAALVAGVGPRVFGEPFTVRRALAGLARRPFALAAAVLLSRLVTGAVATFCLVVPALPVATRYGFFPEALLLERLALPAADRRLAELLRGAFADAAGRLGAIALFAGAFAAAAFVLVDAVSSLLFDVRLFVGRGIDASDYAFLLFDDPRVVALWTASLWLAYAPARIAWFFCYLDLRTRKEGWDLEIAFRVAARRLLDAR